MDMPTPRVAASVADPVLRHRLEAVLDNAGIELVRCVRAPEELEDAGPAFDVAIVAEDMGDVRTAEVLRRLRDRALAPHALIVRTESDGHAVRRALEAGADGLVDAPELERALVPAVLALAVGLIAVPTTMRRQLVPPALSYRERQVLALVVEGCTNGEIARRLFLAESTVKSHLATAFSKLGVRSRRDATALILQSDDALGASVLTLATDGAAGPPPNRRFAPASPDPVRHE
jgi:DNA-binding NarL/FixJ family response regulator